jgi:glyoxylase-like metal-dependent hydrolase (beta-lactamase superfamily II)
MDRERLKESYERLRLLDERLTYKVRPGHGRGIAPMLRPSADQLAERLGDLAEYTVELRAIVEELFGALGAGAKEP